MSSPRSSAQTASAASPVTVTPPRGNRVGLVGPRSPSDPRTTLARADLADASLAGAVLALRYAVPEPRRCVVPTTMLHAAPNGVAVSALLYGETFDVMDVADGWAWGQAAYDGYVGYAAVAALGPPGASNWRVAAPAGLVFSEPNIKAAVTLTLPLNSILAGEAHEEAFVALHEGGFAHSRHVAPIGAFAQDPVAVAGGFLGAPYRWGGRTREGVDCSGLVQAALLACGIDCPRDSDQQRAAFAPVAWCERRRGDLVFVPGHVGLLADADRLLHANAYAMTTWIEPLADMLGRLEPGVEPTAGRPPYIVPPAPCSSDSAPL